MLEVLIFSRPCLTNFLSLSFISRTLFFSFQGLLGNWACMKVSSVSNFRVKLEFIVKQLGCCASSHSLWKEGNHDWLTCIKCNDYLNFCFFVSLFHSSILQVVRHCAELQRNVYISLWICVLPSEEKLVIWSKCGADVLEWEVVCSSVDETMLRSFVM